MNDQIYIQDALKPKLDEIAALLGCDHHALDEVASVLDFGVLWTMTLPAERGQVLAGRLDGFVDGRGLACPMPLLKLKIALRAWQNTQSANDQNPNQDPRTAVIYLVASDPNSATDITAFCQKNALQLHAWQQMSYDKPTIFHFLVIKITSVSSQ